MSTFNKRVNHKVLRRLDSDAIVPSGKHMESRADSAVRVQRSIGRSEAVMYRRQASGLSIVSSQSGRRVSVSPDELITASGTTLRRGVEDQGLPENIQSTAAVSNTKLDVVKKGFRRRLKFTAKSSGPGTLSLLECVVEIFRETSVLKRKNFIHAIDGKIWLSPDMRHVKYTLSKKKSSVPELNIITLACIRRLEGNGKNIIIESETGKKPEHFIFLTSERADIWLSGLSCLIPSNAVAKSSNSYHHLESRQLYDPLLDSWYGKPVRFRKLIAEEYILLGTIGRGSFGKVKLALSQKEMRFYAVKMLSKDMVRKRLREQLLEASSTTIADVDNLNVLDTAEISVLRTLDHPNVMKFKYVYDDVEKDMLFIVVEYLPNGPIMSSAKLVDTKAISEDRARAAFVDVLCGLEYLHRNNIAHRDIKPDNLLQAGDGTVKISDFGAAIKYHDGDEDEDKTSVVIEKQERTIGTPAFTAPELCLSEKSPPSPPRNFAADIWSLGASLFYMLYGQAPFTAGSVFEIYEAICTKPLSFPEPVEDSTVTVSSQAQDVIKMMLIKPPEARAKISDIISTEWLSNCPSVHEKIEEIRMSLQEHDPTYEAEDASQRLSERKKIERISRVPYPLIPGFGRRHKE